MNTLLTRAAVAPDKDGMVAAYEELRRQLQHGQQGPGLALFLRRGMREWMNACAVCTASSPTPVLPAANDEAILPHGTRTEIVLILAGMLLHSRQEVHP